MSCHNQGFIFRLGTRLVQSIKIERIAFAQVLDHCRQWINQNRSRANDALDDGVIETAVIEIQKDQVLGKKLVVFVIAEVRHNLDRIQIGRVADETKFNPVYVFRPAVPQAEENLFQLRDPQLVQRAEFP